MKMFARYKRVFGVIITVFYMLITSPCQAATSLPPFDRNSVPPEPDYAEPSSWLSLPANQDRYQVDIFWVYPTVLHDDIEWLMDYSSFGLKEAAYETIIHQASVFSVQANLYAPFYRQMNIAALSLPEAEKSMLQAYGKQDIRRALAHYLKYYNNDRPFILASHSQGSNVLADLAVEIWGETGAENRLIAAYIIGWSITEDDLVENDAIRMCKNAWQTGCFISYNTVAAGKQNVAPTITTGAIVTNPLTWEIHDVKAPASLNLGAVFFDDAGKSQTIPYFTSAQALDGGLVVEPSDPSFVDSGAILFPKGVYHAFDYSLFYENLRANVAQRIQSFLAK